MQMKKLYAAPEAEYQLIVLTDCVTESLPIPDSGIEFPPMPLNP